MPFSNTYANNFLNIAFAKTASITAPSSVYIGLCSNDPEADKGSVTELSGYGYSRVLISIKGDSTLGIIPSASSRAVTNAKQINWTKATGDWKRVKGFFLSSSGTVGETSSIFFYGKLDLTEEEEAAGGLLVENGMVALFDPAAFSISFADTDATDE